MDELLRVGLASHQLRYYANYDLKEQLTQRESEVLGLLAEGLANTHIAERLAVQESTVKFQLQKIFQKLGVANRTEAGQVYNRNWQGR